MIITFTIRIKCSDGQYQSSKITCMGISVYTARAREGHNHMVSALN